MSQSMVVCKHPEACGAVMHMHQGRGCLCFRLLCRITHKVKPARLNLCAPRLHHGNRLQLRQCCWGLTCATNSPADRLCATITATSCLLNTKYSMAARCCCSRAWPSAGQVKWMLIRCCSAGSPSIGISSRSLQPVMHDTTHPSRKQTTVVRVAVLGVHVVTERPLHAQVTIVSSKDCCRPLPAQTVGCSLYCCCCCCCKAVLPSMFVACQLT